MHIYVNSELQRASLIPSPVTPHWFLSSFWGILISKWINKWSLKQRTTDLMFVMEVQSVAYTWSKVELLQTLFTSLDLYYSFVACFYKTGIKKIWIFIWWPFGCLCVIYCFIKQFSLQNLISCLYYKVIRYLLGSKEDKAFKTTLDN